MLARLIDLDGRCLGGTSLRDSLPNFEQPFLNNALYGTVPGTEPGFFLVLRRSVREGIA